MPERRAIVTLSEREVQWVEQAVLDEDEEAALGFLRDILKPAMDEHLNRPHCKPIFEWARGMDLRPTGSPDVS